VDENDLTKWGNLGNVSRAGNSGAGCLSDKETRPTFVRSVIHLSDFEVWLILWYGSVFHILSRPVDASRLSEK
jgi:hypothetical protein